MLGLLGLLSLVVLYVSFFLNEVLAHVAVTLVIAAFWIWWDGRTQGAADAQKRVG